MPLAIADDSRLSDAGALPFGDCRACRRRAVAVCSDLADAFECSLCGAALPDVFWIGESEFEALGWVAVDPDATPPPAPTRSGGCGSGGCGSGGCGR